MSHRDEVIAAVGGTGELSNCVEWHVRRASYEDGVTMVAVTFDLGGLSLTVEFHPDQAEVFLAELRDHIVEAKREELEWKSDTELESDA